MKKILLGSVGLIALAAALPASAADIRPRTYSKAPVPAYVAPIYDWTGFYIGGQVGGQWGNDLNGLKPDGVVGGVHVGYNWQTGALVVGVESDFEGANVRDSSALGGGLTESFRNRWQGSVRGRVGWAVSPQMLLYGTGGVAFAENLYRVTDGLTTDSWHGQQVGYTVGGGLEYMFAPAWSARAEYRYTAFGSKTNVGSLATVGTDPDNHSVRLGVSYRWGGPVISKY